MDEWLGRSNKAVKLEDNDTQQFEDTAKTQVGDPKTAKDLNVAWAGNICHPKDTSVVSLIHKRFISLQLC